MGTTTIEWTERTWNPVVGCRMCSPGCANCYAMRMSARLAAMATADVKAGRNPGKKSVYLKVVDEKGDWNAQVIPVEAELSTPLAVKKPARWFVNSMSDLFYGDEEDRIFCEKKNIPFTPVPFEFIDRVFAVMALCPQHTFQILTKRPARMAEYLTERSGEAMGVYHRSGARSSIGGPGPIVNAMDVISPEAGTTIRNFRSRWPLPNVWLGTSVEDQTRANLRIPQLQACPGAVRFLSCEPLLSSINHTLDGIHWLIAGGESGSRARPMHPDWARSIRDQCQAAGVSFFFKQWGEYFTDSVNMTTGAPIFRQFSSYENWVSKASTRVQGGICLDTKGRELKIGADFMRARDENAFPVIVMDRVGKKRAGRMLDGREWSEMPAQRENTTVQTHG